MKKSDLRSDLLLCTVKFLSPPYMKFLRIFFIVFCSSLLLAACAKDNSSDNVDIPVLGNSTYSNRTNAQRQISRSFVIAHRGYWDSDNPQNSLSSMKRALLLEIYGTEMDIHQTKDGIIIVNHDPTYHGLSIKNSSYEELSKYTLSNGEPIPLFESFLQVKKDIGGSVKLIVELKDCNVIDLLSLIDSYGLQSEVEFISFSINLCNQLVNLGYGYKTYYLGGNISPVDIKAKGYGGIDYSDSSYSSYPDWIQNAQNIGLRTIVWTVNNTDKIINDVQQGVLVTTDKPVEASAACNNLKGDETGIQQVTTH